MFQRVGEFSEHPHVLDRDHGLVGEGLEELNLAVCERLNLESSEAYRPDRLSFPQERRIHEGAQTNWLYARACWRKDWILFGQNVVDVHGLTGRENVLVQRFIGNRKRGNRIRDRADVGHETEHVTINQAHRRILCATHSRGALHNRIEHRLQITRRLRDDPQDIAGRRLLLRALANFLRLRGDRLL